MSTLTGCPRCAREAGLPWRLLAVSLFSRDRPKACNLPSHPMGCGKKVFFSPSNCVPKKEGCYERHSQCANDVSSLGPCLLGVARACRARARLAEEEERDRLELEMESIQERTEYIRSLLCHRLTPEEPLLKRINSSRIAAPVPHANGDAKVRGGLAWGTGPLPVSHTKGMPR